MNDSGSVHGLTERNILTAFPIALQGDRDAAALAEVTARLLARRPEEIDRLRIYPAIDRLDEKLLDLLAYDFKVDWWDADYSLEEKRRTLADSWRVHKILGTKSAVETALRAIYPNAEIQEWFQYGGKPYFFKLNINLTGEISDAARPWRVLERVNFYKSLRSHVDEIVFTFVLPPATIQVGGGAGAQASIGIPLQPDSYYFQDTVYAGGNFGVQPSIGAPLQPDNYRFQDTVHIGGDLGVQPSVGVPNQPDTYKFQGTLHTGATGSIHTSSSVPVQPDKPYFTAPLHAGGRLSAHGSLSVPEDTAQSLVSAVARTGGAFSAGTRIPVTEDVAQPSATTILRTGGVCTIISNLSKGE